MTPVLDFESEILRTAGDPLFGRFSAANSRVSLCSPFIGFDTANRIAKLAKPRKVSWKLMTVLNPAAAAYGALSLDGLKRMIGAGVEVRHMPDLHAKVFLVDDNVGFAGSANLTSSGLGMGERRNREITVVLTSAQRSETEGIMTEWWSEAKTITIAMIEECGAAARRVPVRASRVDELAFSDGDVALANSLLEQSLHSKVWLKAMFAYNSEDWVNSSKKGKPSFRAGDILVIYVKKTGCCYSVVQVTGDTRNDPAFLVQHGRTADEAKRWPWVTPVKALLALPPRHGAPIAEVGKSGKSLQGGHCDMPIGGFPLILQTMLRMKETAAREELA
jgi:PLD-like domain